MIHFYQMYSSNYLFFVIGFILISLASLLYSLSRRRAFLLKNRTMIYFVYYLLILGLSLWMKFLYYIFSDKILFEQIAFYLSFIAYIALFEFGRRTIIQLQLKLSIGVGLIGLVIIIMYPSVLALKCFISYIGALMVTIGFWQQYRREKESNLQRKNSTLLVFFLLFLLLTLNSLLFIPFTFDGNANYISQIVPMKEMIDWLISISLTIFLLHSIKITIEEPLDIQLKRVSLFIIKLVIVGLVFILLLGSTFLYEFKKVYLDYEKEKLLNIAPIVSLNINGNLHRQINSPPFDESKYAYKLVNEELKNIKNQVEFISSISTIFIKNDNFVYGVDSKHQYGELVIDNLSELQKTYQHKQTIVIVNEYVERAKNNINVYTPIKDITGKTVALLKLDINGGFLQNIKLINLYGVLIVLSILLLYIGAGYSFYIYRKNGLLRSNQTKIMSSIRDVVWVFDKEGRIIYTNDSILPLKGYISTMEKKMMVLSDFFQQDDLDRIKDIIANLLDGQYISSEFYIKISEKSLPVYASISYLDHENGNPLYTFIAIDISDQKAREKEIHGYFQDTLSLLATVIDAKDDYTAKHSFNVANYAKKIAIELNLTADEISEIETAALIHDIGKIGIPDHILKKESSLTKDEWGIMKKHPEFGKQILEKANNSFKHLIPYVYAHHERFDGKGYPKGIEHQGLKQSIITVADAFDAMTSNRAYRKKMSLEKVKEELLKNSGTQFNPEVVQSLLRLLQRHQLDIINELED